MAEYIDRDKFLKMISHKPNSPITDREDRLINAFISAVKNYPVAEVRPVVRGRWISHDFVDMGKGRYTGSVECSACGRFLPLKENFCPNCGADMREANDEKA